MHAPALLPPHSQPRALTNHPFCRETEAHELEAFITLLRAAHHPLLVRSRYGETDLAQISAACERASAFCVSNTSTAAAPPGSCPVASLRHCSDLKLHQICGSVPGLQALVLPPDAFRASGKIRALEAMLESTRPSSEYGVVVSSAFSSMLDIVEVVVGGLEIARERIDAATDEVGAAEARGRFCCGEVHLLLLQQEAALRMPELNLSRTVDCIFYDSGINLAVCCFCCDLQAFYFMQAEKQRFMMELGQKKVVLMGVRGSIHSTSRLAVVQIDSVLDRVWSGHAAAFLGRAERCRKDSVGTRHSS
jgi:hypothetical protein